MKPLCIWKISTEDKKIPSKQEDLFIGRWEEIKDHSKILLEEYFETTTTMLYEIYEKDNKEDHHSPSVWLNK